MVWLTEDSPVQDAVSPLGTEQCEPCIKFFNPVLVPQDTGEVALIDLDFDSHLNHYVVESGYPVTFRLNPLYKDTQGALGWVVLITRNSDYNVLVDDSLMDPSILRGLKQIDEKGDTIGLISITPIRVVIAGATRLVV